MSDLIRDYSSTIITVLTALGLMGAGARFIWHRAMQPFIEIQNAAADVIRLQLTPNHGSSLVDKVNRIEANHREAKGHWESLEANDQEAQRQYEGLKADLREVVKRLEKIEQATATPRGYE